MEARDCNRESRRCDRHGCKLAARQAPPHILPKIGLAATQIWVGIFRFEFLLEMILVASLCPIFRDLVKRAVAYF